jgi:hypothetical protein
MRQRWLNDKQPDENGDIVLVIENNAGTRISTFKGKTIEDVADALAESQVQANRQLARVMKPDAGRQPMRVEPRELLPVDRQRLSTEITDPDHVVEAVNEIVTATQGTSPANVGKKFAEFDQNEADEYYRREAQAFVEDYPEYYPVQENQEALFQQLRASRYDLTRNNLAIVFQQLLSEGKLVLWPEEGNSSAASAPEPPAPPSTPRPRSYASGLRNSDASANRPPPTPRKPLITKAELERMSRAEYNERLHDPAFRRAVDALA